MLRVMSAPKDELPNIDHIRRLAKMNLPTHIILREVRCTCCSDSHFGIPEDYEIMIEFEDTLDEKLRGSSSAIEGVEAWVHPIVQAIRSEWPPETVRITFASTSSQQQR